jgi:hypothetical protein
VGAFCNSQSMIVSPMLRLWIFEATDCAADNADLTAYGDASGIGMGFYFFKSNQGFQSILPHAPPKDVIFYFEALTVLSIVEKATSLTPILKWLIIFSDNMNTIDIFSSLRAKPHHSFAQTSHWPLSNSHPWYGQCHCRFIVSYTKFSSSCSMSWPHYFSFWTLMVDDGVDVRGLPTKCNIYSWNQGYSVTWVLWPFSLMVSGQVSMFQGSPYSGAKNDQDIQYVPAT